MFSSILSSFHFQPCQLSAILLSARVISVHLSSSQLFSFLSPLVLHVGKADILTSKLLLASGSTHVAKDPSVSQIVRITFSVGVYLRKKHMCFYLFMFFIFFIPLQNDTACHHLLNFWPRLSRHQWLKSSLLLPTFASGNGASSGEPQSPDSPDRALTLLGCKARLTLQMFQVPPLLFCIIQQW